ncbi:heavy-metal-associated domain-containing protein [Treponema brennaborense]|uniref:Heavy metal transport/detoxification protein n=1 Tax=Treponema brennaborense (strain DSM 12168 / CIP 105900 / DD5/3) TaxID=906968 RepID=F4LIX1_TREBD|nr:heavy-metal-associated domain-containing protein [Treponema brennaborense]AEE17280.1 Heavy metal transport/detoxification protein [Treponema brennaborense DSM 12168]
MVTLQVPDMHCAKCVARISKALDDAGLTYRVSLEDKTVSIDGCDNCVRTAVQELDDLGFSASVKK